MCDPYCSRRSQLAASSLWLYTAPSSAEKSKHTGIHWWITRLNASQPPFIVNLQFLYGYFLGLMHLLWLILKLFKYLLKIGKYPEYPLLPTISELILRGDKESFVLTLYKLLQSEYKEWSIGPDREDSYTTWSISYLCLWEYTGSSQPQFPAQKKYFRLNIFVMPILQVHQSLASKCYKGELLS